MLGAGSIEQALADRPATMVSVAPETWVLLEEAYTGGGLAAEFNGAWMNGRAFLEATDGLRNRIPGIVEWKASHRVPGDDVVPADLRIDHVFLVSCKYLSKILINASPFHLFERLLAGGHGIRGGDWYQHVAPLEYERLFVAAKRAAPSVGLRDDLASTPNEDRRALAAYLRGDWPPELRSEVDEFVSKVATTTAELWNGRLASLAACESLLWKLLRMSNATYYVLGGTVETPLRLRVGTPWDWRVDFRLRDFSVSAQPGGQPRVGWRAVVEDRRSRATLDVVGHVEIRWSHGRFAGNPEAKVYLDTAHDDVPGYYPLA